MRLLTVGAIFLVGSVQCFYWTFIALFIYLFRRAFSNTPAEMVAESTYLALALIVVVLVHVIVLLAFLHNSRGYGWWSLAIVQAAAFVVMVVLGATSDGIGLAANSPWWVSGAAALTVLLLIALRRTDAMPADPPFPG
jgi:lysylphosphatidylglycerol synthetase-like protein (DUF2156 family)